MKLHYLEIIFTYVIGGIGDFLIKILYLIDLKKILGFVVSRQQSCG